MCDGCKSTAIVYPVNLSEYSEESYTEQMLEILNSGDIRDDLIEGSGQTPSNTRQTNREEQIRLERKRLMDGLDGL